MNDTLDSTAAQKYQWRIETLERELAALKAPDGPVGPFLDRIRVLERELAALKGRTCATCDERAEDETGEAVCLRTVADYESGERTRCATLGNGCRAWRKRKETP